MANNDSLLDEHKRTWTGFVRLMTYGTVAVVAALVFLAWVAL